MGNIVRILSARRAAALGWSRWLHTAVGYGYRAVIWLVDLNGMLNKQSGGKTKWE